MKSLTEAITAHNALDRVVNRMSAEAFREKATRRAQEEAFTEGVKDEIEEQIKAWAFNAGLNTKEQFAEVMARGELGDDVLQYLTNIGAETSEAAVEALYRIAGDEAGIMMDPYIEAFDKRPWGSKHPLDVFIRPDLPPRRKGKSKTKGDVARRVGRWRADAEPMTLADEAVVAGFDPFAESRNDPNE